MMTTGAWACPLRTIYDISHRVGPVLRRHTAHGERKGSNLGLWIASRVPDERRGTYSRTVRTHQLPGPLARHDVCLATAVNFPQHGKEGREEECRR